MGIMKHLKGPFGLQATLSSDLTYVRVINADLGDDLPYSGIADVRYRKELTLDENLATADLLRAAPQMRDAILAQLNPFVNRAEAHKQLMDAVAFLDK